jgi:hypothetical protein
VIRATTLLIVLALMGTLTATAVCVASHGCDEVLQAALFTREDPQRVGSGSAPDHAIALMHVGVGEGERDRTPSAGSPEIPLSLQRQYSTGLRI